MTKTSAIEYLRLNCKVQDPTTATDTAFLSLTDDQIALVLNVAIAKVSPMDSIDNIPDSVLYPIILVAKKELYYQLAIVTSPFYPISLGDDGSIKRNTRFDHYMSLITKIEAEYESYISLNTPIVSGDIKLVGRYFTRRNYNLSSPPVPTLVADSVSSVSVDLSWSVTGVDRFHSYTIYKSLESIVDLYVSDFPIKSSAEKVVDFLDIHNTYYRLTGLSPSTNYHVALVVQECNGLKGYSEISFTTLLS